MSESISGIVNQLFQHSLQQQQNLKPPAQTTEKRSFESHLQPQKTPDAADGTSVNSGTDKSAANVSGADLQSKLDQLGTTLTERFKQNSADQNKVNSMLPEMLDNKSRIGLLKEAYSKIGDTSKTANNLSGQFTQVESEFKAVESIMRSDKKLSPGELLALQARLYQVSQHIEVMSKVVDQMAGGIKTILNTNV